MSEEEWINSTTDKRAYLRDKSKLAKIKVSNGCEECGYDNHPDALDFHHINKEEKNFNVASFTKRNIPFEDVEEEIEKCKILCSNCHRQKEATYSFSV
jgi:5-methylcytosine-specific restriction endonuclease McrA